MPGPADEDRVGVALGDDPAEMGIDEVETGAGTPVAHQAGFGVLRSKRLQNQGVVEQDRSDRRRGSWLLSSRC